jgi:peptidoglycan/xylan/chitin deacetylase (PgdA/CDA1 family)
VNRREFLAVSGAATAGVLAAAPAGARKQASLAITLDLEMSRNFPTWEATHWDYEKGNLDEATKRYAIDVARRVKAHGGAVHFFLVGRALEQESVEWLQELLATGHRVGNHTYDHVNVKARRPAELQPRFNRAPWLVAGREPAAVVRENIQLCTDAMKARLGTAPSGFRTPGGFTNGLEDVPAVQQMLVELGFTWCSSKYPRTPTPPPGEEPDAAALSAIARAQADAQPYRYPGGLLEIPMSPISDIGAFRNLRWKLDWFLHAVRASVEWAIEHGTVFDFLAHPSCLGVVDPDGKTIELICELVAGAGERARLVTLDQLAEEAGAGAKV